MLVTECINRVKFFLVESPLELIWSLLRESIEPCSYFSRRITSIPLLGARLERDACEQNQNEETTDETVRRPTGYP